MRVLQQQAEDQQEQLRKVHASQATSSTAQAASGLLAGNSLYIAIACCVLLMNTTGGQSV